MRWSSCVVALLGLVLPGCGNPSSTDILDEFEAPDGSFVIRFLGPPWELVEAEREPFVFRIISNRSSFGGLDAAFMPKFQLDVTVESGAPRARAQRDERDAAARGDTVEVPVREVTTDSGVMGFEVLTSTITTETRFFRNVYLSHPRGVLRLAFQATPELDTAEVNAMVAAVEIRDP